jgi:soluble lytic murein transglycosylase-like protein/tetratricopeptide (TPR) repeat protein
MDLVGRFRTRRAWRIGALALGALLVVLAIAGVRRARTREVAHAREGGAEVVSDPGSSRPVNEWTDRFVALQSAGDWAGLDAELDGILSREPDQYRHYRLAYLHARTKLALGEPAEARPLLEPFLAEGHPLRDLALHHAAAAEDAAGNAEAAAALREDLALNHREGSFRNRALEDHIEWLAANKHVDRLRALASRLSAQEDADAIRAIESHVVALTVGQDPGAVAAGLRLLRANSGDDAAERVSRALGRDDIVSALPPSDWVLLGESNRGHRHYDQAVAQLEKALAAGAGNRGELLYSIGRAHFGAEQYEAAERRYLEGAALPGTAEDRGNFFYNAARSAQLAGDDARAEKHLGDAIRAGARTSRASSALTQRVRLRAKQGRHAEAKKDLAAVRRLFPRSHAVVEASLAYATAMVAAGRNAEALSTLNAIPKRLLDKADVPEVDYWRARALESTSVAAAGRAYLNVLQADTPTHFAYFARKRMAQAPLAARLATEAAARERRAAELLARGDDEGAREAQTEAVLLSAPADAPRRREKLVEIYKRLPKYRAILEAPPPTYPKLPLFGAAADEEPPRLDLLLALGLFDDAAEDVIDAYPLQPLESGIARSEALRRGLAGRGSIAAIEASLQLPDGYLPELLPRLVRELLFPRFFYEDIAFEARKHGADPRLVLSIMREESRFNIRAKSPAAARGLLQFIIGTAREVGESIGLLDVEATDLYEPDVIIQLGARYIGDLLKQFGGDPYKAAAAYNAGPKQAALWQRMAPGPGADQFLTAVNFDETKNYVRKVLNSYERYREIYESGEPVGGVRPEP